VQISLQLPRKWAGVITQGRHGAPQWVTNYKVTYTNNGTAWKEADGGKIFNANSDSDTAVRNNFAQGFYAKAIRICPTSWSSHISMRVEGVYFAEKEDDPEYYESRSASSTSTFTSTPATSGGSIVKLKNLETNRYAFCPADKNEKEGSEGGWIGPKTQDKPLLGVDANYYNRAMWEVEKRGEVILLRNHESKRLMFDQGDKFEGNRGVEGGWIGPTTKKALSADANYYNRAMWKVEKHSNGSVSLVNVETNRMLFDTSPKFEGKAGEEGGWIGPNSQALVTVDANYYNRAMWVVEGPPLA